MLRKRSEHLRLVPRIDELHVALFQAEADDEFIVDADLHIDEGIADAVDVERDSQATPPASERAPGRWIPR